LQINSFTSHRQRSQKKTLNNFNNFKSEIVKRFMVTLLLKLPELITSCQKNSFHGTLYQTPKSMSLLKMI
jgi:hypothetical protein